jgi:hypothetical protein
MNAPRPPANGYQSRIRTSTIRLFRWNFGWAAATLLMAFGPKLFWDKASALTLLAVGLDVAVGIGMILANKKYLEDLDELQRKIYLNALGITVGVALIAVVPYAVLDAYHVVHFKAAVGYLVILMSLTFLASLVYGNWRYR